MIEPVCLFDKLSDLGVHYAVDARWVIATDMNCDGAVTISDVALWVSWLFYLPGDGFLWLLMQYPEAVVFLELMPSAYGEWISAILSVMGWLIALIVLISIAGASFSRQAAQSE